MAQNLSCDVCALKFGSCNVSNPFFMSKLLLFAKNCNFSPWRGLKMEKLPKPKNVAFHFQEVIEHKCSLPHQIKDNRLNPNSKRECAICHLFFESLADFSRHLETDSHTQALERFRRPPRALVMNRRTNFTGYINDVHQSRIMNSNEPGPSSSSSSYVDPYRLRRQPIYNHPPPPGLSRPFYAPVNAGIGRGRCMNTAPPPPWYALPPLQFSTSPPPSSSSAVEYAEEAFSDLVRSFQQSPSQPPPPPPPRQPQSAVSNQNWRPMKRQKELIQSDVSAFEPDVPINIRNLAHSERYNPTTQFTKKKQRQDYMRLKMEADERRKKKKKKKDKLLKESEANTDDVTTTGGGEKTKKPKKKKKQRDVERDARRAAEWRLTMAAKCSNSDSATETVDQSGDGPSTSGLTNKETAGGKKRQEADSTTSLDADGSSPPPPPKRKAVSVPISAAAFVKRQRLIAKAHSVSDKLLADRLSRYRLVSASGESNASKSGTTVATTTGTTSAPAQDSQPVVMTLVRSRSSNNSNYNLFDFRISR